MLEAPDVRVVTSGTLRLTAYGGPASPTPSGTTPTRQWSLSNDNFALASLGPIRKATPTKTSPAQATRPPSSPDDDRKPAARSVAETKRKRRATTAELTGKDDDIDTTSKKPRSSVTDQQLASAYSDKLGTLIQASVERLHRCGDWETFVDESRGRPYLSETVGKIPHPAADFLDQLRKEGVPAKASDPEWTPEQRNEKFHRGCHASAEMHKAFIREELAEFIECGYWTVLPYRLVKDLLNLRLSPLGIKEERERKPRLVCDHSFFGINQNTITRTPPEAMQFGGTLQRVLNAIRHADPRFGPVHLSKYDIKDGFYRLFLNANDAPMLAVTLPTYEGEEPMVAIPLVLTMGWTESPPTFCSASETIADLANANAYKHHVQPHRLEENCDPGDQWNLSACRHLRLTKPAPVDLPAQPSYQGKGTRLQPTLEPVPEETGAAGPAITSPGDASSPEPTKRAALAPLPAPPSQVSNRPWRQPLRRVDVFVDDFIGLVQGTRRQMRNLRRHILHAIDAVFDQPLPGETRRQEAASVKKLLKGDGSWTTRKLILGWIIDTVQGTLELPPHRQQRLRSIFDSLRGKTRISKRHWMKYLGELRFMSTGIQGSAGLFGALQLGLKEADPHRVRISKHIREHLDDFERLAQDLCDRPTKIAELLPEHPTVIQAVDAAKAGMGGVIFCEGEAPILWRQPFPPEVQRRVVSADNPSGDLTNSDLEQAALLAGADVANRAYDLRELTLGSLSDNTPAISRKHRGTVTAASPAAYLCRSSSAHQRHYRYHEETSHISGDANGMADDTSRLQHLSIAQLLTHFNATYPQNLSWTSCQLNSATNSEILSCLSMKTDRTLSWLPPHVPGKLPKRSGSSYAPCWAPNLTSATSTPSPTSTSSKSLASGTGKAKSPKAVSPSELTQWRRPLVTWGRSSPTWVHRIPECSPGPRSTFPLSRGGWSPSTKATLPPPESTLATSPSSARLLTSHAPLQGNGTPDFSTWWGSST